jgi:hypothetical protein
MATALPTCDHGIISGSVHPCEECSKAICAECGAEYIKTCFVVCADCLTKTDQRNKETKRRLLGHIPYVSN